MSDAGRLHGEEQHDITQVVGKIAFSRCRYKNPFEWIAGAFGYEVAFDAGERSPVIDIDKIVAQGVDEYGKTLPAVDVEYLPACVLTKVTCVGIAACIGMP